METQADGRRYICNVSGPGGFTEMFTAGQVEVMERMGLIKWTKVTSTPDAVIHFYEKK